MNNGSSLCCQQKKYSTVAGSQKKPANGCGYEGGGEGAVARASKHEKKSMESELSRFKNVYQSRNIPCINMVARTALRSDLLEWTRLQIEASNLPRETLTC